jgi:hypothetical protein
LTLPFSKTVFILISPPQEQKNFWVALEVRAFLLAWAISFLLAKGRQKPTMGFQGTRNMLFVKNSMKNSEMSTPMIIRP